MTLNINKTILFASILGIAISSCRKSEQTTSMDPMSVFSTTIFDNTQSDFSILVSSSLGISVLTPNDVNKTATVVVANEKNTKNVGILKVNNTPIPFEKTHYFLQSDTVLTAATFIGKSNEYQLVTNNVNGFSSFTKTHYSPNVSLLSYNGLIDNSLPRTSNLTINWTNDTIYSGLRAIVLIVAEDSLGNMQSIQKIPTATNSSMTFTAGELSVFATYQRIGIYYARGYNTVEILNGKSIDFQFINYSHSTIYFQ